MRKRQRREGGFTLLELMVALAITVAASAVILTHLRTLMDVESRVRRSQHAVSMLLDEAAQISYRSFANADKSLQGDRIFIHLPGKDEMHLELSNHPSNSDQGVPIDMAFTPFQEYQVDRGRFSITFIYRGLISAGF